MVALVNSLFQPRQVVGKSPTATVVYKKSDSPKMHFREWIGFRLHGGTVGCDTAAAVHLPATVGQFDFRGSRVLVIVKIVIKRGIFVIALNEASTRRVIARGRECQTGVFT